MSAQVEHQNFWKAGEKYFNGIKQGRINSPEIFNSEIIYNMLAMSMEKFLFSFLVYNNNLQDYKSFFDLIDSVSSIKKIPPPMYSKLIRFDKLLDNYEVCDAVQSNKGTDGFIDEMMLLVEDVAEFCKCD